MTKAYIKQEACMANPNLRQNNRYVRRNSETARHAAAYYTHDSTARQISEAAPEYQPRPQRKIRKKQKRGFAYDIQARHRQNFMSYVLLVAFFACLTAFLALGARYEYSKVQLESARSELVALQNLNMIIADEIYASLDMAAIEAFAINELGMGPPEEFQLMEITVQPQSYFAHTGSNPVTSNSFNIPRFWDNLFSVAGVN